MGHLIWILVVIADVWATLHILQSPAAAGEKLLWVLLIFLLPILGLLIWHFFGPKALSL